MIDRFVITIFGIAIGLIAALASMHVIGRMAIEVWKSLVKPQP